jgi:hypothetical protein
MPSASGPTAEQLLKRSSKVYEELELLRSKQNAAESKALKEDEESDETDEASDEIVEASDETVEASDETDKADDETASGEAEAPPAAGNSVSVIDFIVTMRSSASKEFRDWVPVALVALACGEGADHSALMPSAVGASAREIFECGCKCQSSLRKVDRNTVEYAFENQDSFELHVYEGLNGRADRRTSAYETLGLEDGATPGEVKKAHRKFMLELHPDKFIGDDAGAEAAKERMLEVQDAYQELGGGQDRSVSVYESIGGKARVDFSGTLQKAALAPLGKPRPEQEMAYAKGGWRVGIAPMIKDVAQEFVARNIAGSGS